MKPEAKTKEAVEIKNAIDKYFLDNPDINKIRAKDLMPHFITLGIYVKDYRNGLPIRNLLRHLDRNNLLHLIPQVDSRRKDVYTNWYFINMKVKSDAKR